jgi:hypothetical protein
LTTDVLAINGFKRSRSKDQLLFICSRKHVGGNIAGIKKSPAEAELCFIALNCELLQ